MRDWLKKIYKLLTHKIAKRILGVMIIFWLSSFAFNTNFLWAQEAYAQWTETNEALEKKLEQIEFMDMILKVIYILMWPLLVIAWWSLDNSLVYGSLFHLDEPLWKFWNIMKNFANFTLWFMVLYSILKHIFTLGESGKDSPKTIITNTLVAWVLIQASWFILAAVIDISTIATYAIGGMPLSVLDEDNDTMVLAVNSELNLNELNTSDFKKDLNITYKYGKNGEYKFAPCKIKNNYIIWVEYYDMDIKGTRYSIWWGSSENEEQATDAYCVLWWNVVPYASYLLFNLSSINNNTEYQRQLSELDDTILSSKPVNKIGDNITMCTSVERGKDALRTAGWMTISKLVKESNNFLWPMLSIYTSIMDFAQLSTTSVNNGSGWIAVEMVVKLIFAIALFAPLIALAVVLIVRILYLWIIIAISPIYVIKWVFKIDIPLLWSIWKGGDKVDSVSNIIKIIFMPVIIVFALSLCLIFMNAVNQTANEPCKNVEQSNFLEEMWITHVKYPESQREEMRINGLTTIRYKSSSFNGAMDMTWWLITQLFGVAIVWAILWVAIKHSSSIGENIWWYVENLSKSIMKTIPIVPIWEGVGYGTASQKIFGKDAESSIIGQKLTQINSGQSQALSEDLWLLDKEEPSKTTTITNQHYETVATWLTWWQNVSGVFSNESMEWVNSNSMFGNATHVQNIENIINKETDVAKQTAGIKKLAENVNFSNMSLDDANKILSTKVGEQLNPDETYNIWWTNHKISEGKFVPEAPVE